MAAGLLAGLVSLMVALPAQAATFTTVLAESSSSSEDNWGPLALFVLGPVVYGAIHAFYRNPAARHRYEIDTDIKIDHLAIVDFTGFENLINAIGGVEVNVPHEICGKIAGGAGHGQGGLNLHLKKGMNTLDGQTALAYARMREPSECPGPGVSAYTLGYNDLNREKAQQSVITGVKERLTSVSRLPYNFIMGPIIGWDAPKAFISDMGFFTMPQLVLAAAIGGSSGTDVLCGNPAKEGCSLEGPGGSIEVPQSARRAAVKRLMG